MIMTELDYKIEECFEPKNMKVYFLVYSLKPTPSIIGPQFDTLEEAKECVKMCRKYKDRVFHYVE